MRLAALALLAAALPVFGQYKMQNPAGEAPGPWLFGTIGVGKGPDGKPLTTALKGLAIRLGENGEAGIAYDLDLCRVAGAWTGGKFVTPMNLMSRGEYPTALGEVLFTTGEVPGFQIEPPGIPTQPPGIPTQPPGIPTQPSGIPTQPSGIPTQPSGIPTQPSGIPTQPSGIHTQPSGIPTQPPGIPTQPPGIPTQPSGIPTQPSGIRTQPPGIRTQPPGIGPFPPTSPSGQQKDSPAAPKPASAAWTDPRPEPFGPLPPGQARFKGLYVYSGKTVLKWDVGGVEVLEIPEYAATRATFHRHFRIAPRAFDIRIVLGPAPPGKPLSITGHSIQVSDRPRNDIGQLVWHKSPLNPQSDLIWWAQGNLSELGCESDEGLLSVRIPPSDEPIFFRCGRWEGSGFAEVGSLNPTFRVRDPYPVFAALTAGHPARWPETLTTGGSLSPDTTGAYVVDTVKAPDTNPWGAPMFISGFDFFGTGKGKPAEPKSAIRIPQPAIWSAAVCTFHGDVFLVAGLEGDLGAVRWRRFASGLYHPLGLKIVDGEVFVTCRDGLFRLRDLNGDGEADYYEAFNYEVKVTKSFHEFVFDLQTDAAGNFYFAKAGPVKNGGRGFDEIMAHHGTLMRVSPDGAKLDVVATGFRAPNGIGVGPHGELTSGDNEGTWTPTCKINWIKLGGFYGVVPLAHRPEPPTDYDRPLCWLPKRVDNSGGSQVWVPDGDRWGPWRGQLLHLSYGKAALYGVLREDIQSAIRNPQSAITQGGVVKFPLKFESGIMRARFHPQDGSLWVAGLRGWQTDGLKNGCLQRVRYTDKLARMPIELHAKKTGVTLRFTDSLDTQSAADPENWNVEVWNYVWSAAYGSPEISTLGAGEQPGENGKEFTRAQMTKTQHDTLKVRAVQVGTDDRSVTLDVEGLKPVMQMAIKYRIKGSDGAPIEGEVVNTIHALGD